MFGANIFGQPYFGSGPGSTAGRRPVLELTLVASRHTALVAMGCRQTNVTAVVLTRDTLTLVGTRQSAKDVAGKRQSSVLIEALPTEEI